MPRNIEQNNAIRKERRGQILDAALTIYVRLGYSGADMDAVAAEAQMAKGLLYYYYKTKKDLFGELCSHMFDEGYAHSRRLLKETEGMDPVEQLMRYVYSFFGANKADPRMMQFYMRFPFDAYAIFDPEQRMEKAEKSDLHRRALAGIIARGVEQGAIPAADPWTAANSFWTVFVANLFEYSRLIAGKEGMELDREKAFEGVVRFCFQGLGIEQRLWNASLRRIITEAKNGGKDW